MAVRATNRSPRRVWYRRQGWAYRNSLASALLILLFTILQDLCDADRKRITPAQTADGGEDQGKTRINSLPSG